MNKSPPFEAKSTVKNLYSIHSLNPSNMGTADEVSHVAEVVS